METNTTTLLLTSLVILIFLLVVVGNNGRQEKRKIEAIFNSRLVRVKSSKYQYGIPQNIKNKDGSNKVEVIFPTLERKNWFSEDKIVKLVRSIHDLADIEPLNSLNNTNCDYFYIQEIQPLVKTYIEIDPEIAGFKAKREEIIKIRKLVNTSKVYAARAENYTKAISELDNAIQKALDLKDECLDLIREILISAEISKVDTNGYLDNDVAIEFKVQEISQNFQQFKLDAQSQIEAYTEVLQLSEGIIE